MSKVIGVTWAELGMRVQLPWGRGLSECSPPADKGYSLHEGAGNAVEIRQKGQLLQKLVGVVGVIHYGPPDSDDGGTPKAAAKTQKPQLP